MRVRLCFLVKVRKASGRSVAGGRRMGRTVDLAAGRRAGGARIGAVRRGSMGWTGVPKAGDEEGIGFAPRGGFGGTENGFSGRLEVDMATGGRGRSAGFVLPFPLYDACLPRGASPSPRARDPDYVMHVMRVMHAQHQSRDLKNEAVEPHTIATIAIFSVD